MKRFFSLMGFCLTYGLYQEKNLSEEFPFLFCDTGGICGLSISVISSKIMVFKNIYKSVADPGFPVGGGADPLGGAPTSDAYTFWQKCMQKQKKWILLGGTCQRHPLDPPM